MLSDVEEGDKLMLTRLTPVATLVKNNSTAYHAIGKYCMQARGFLNYRLKYCWPKVIYCICLGLSDGRYFTSLAGILLLI